MNIEIDKYGKKHICVTGSDISDQIKFEEKTQGSKTQEITFVDLAEIIDVQAIQFLMDDFYNLVHMPIGLNDLKGKVLAGAGWQDICTKFHWVHPEACKHCIGSGTKLSEDVLQGETKLYKCKNNMWDITAPIMVDNLHVGDIFSGQFFFNDDILDYEHFRSLARKYGFDEEKYIRAFEKVPRLSRAAVETGMSFFLKFANLISQLSYSNIKLAKSLAEHDALVDELKEIEKNDRIRVEELEVILDAVPAAVLITHDSRALKITGNRLSYEWLRLPGGSNIFKSAQERARNETPKLFKNGVEIPFTDMPARLAASGKELHDYEVDLVDLDGSERHLLGNARPLKDEQGNSHGFVSAFIDITERKKSGRSP
jgi:ligand-binding sensor protein